MNPQDRWKSYKTGKQTFTQLATDYDCSVLTIKRIINLHKIKIPTKTPEEATLLMDTTY